MKKLFIKFKTSLFDRFNLRFLILVALLVMVITAGAAYFLVRNMGGLGGKDKEVAEISDSFEIGSEQIKSIGEVVGDREMFSMETESKGNTEKTKYIYTDLTTGAEDIKAYASYLKDECGFVPLMKFDVENPAGYLSYGKASIDDGYVLKVDIDYTNNDYTIYTSKSESDDIPLTDPNEEKGGLTREGMVTYLGNFGNKVLGLEKPVSSYISIFDVGRTVINNADCYGINLYKKSEDGKSNLVVGKFYIPITQDYVYKYDILTDSFTQIKIFKPKAPGSIIGPVQASADTDYSLNKKETTENSEETKETDVALTKEEIKAKKKADKEKEKRLKAVEEAELEAQKAEQAAIVAEKQAEEAKLAAEAERKKAEEVAASLENDAPPEE